MLTFCICGTKLWIQFNYLILPPVNQLFVSLLICKTTNTGCIYKYLGNAVIYRYVKDILLLWWKQIWSDNKNVSRRKKFVPWFGPRSAVNSTEPVTFIKETKVPIDRCSMKSIPRVCTVSHPTSIGCIRPTLIELFENSQICHYHSYHIWNLFYIIKLLQSDNTM